MAKKRAYLMIAMSLVMGIAAAWMARNWIQSAGRDSGVQMASVVAADLGIPFGTKVQSRHLKVLEMPAEFVPPGSFDSIDDVLERVTLQPIVAGEILMKGRFVDYDDGSTLAALVGKNMRAVTVRVDDVIGVAGFLLPGNLVDVLASRQAQDRRATAETILRAIKVLAVDQTAAADNSEPVIVRAVTLEMSPEHAEVLFKAREEGSIQLTLRNPLDDEELLVEELPVEEVEVAQPVSPAPRRVVAPPTREFPVTIIRGTNVSVAKASS